ncbi:hypothetical protein M446_1189 [Methylobacterium sp. 4-46]|uniref:hypothetical protein n=1 Tax=unclassified Methylobacterium TaxID=2615210 RepID=UPI000165C8DF|nr:MULTISPECIES: hypothetical protein [Methylobacterium]ACA15714.1 hypothetical protein M446_1189 [Methylobacterium sp. 4-46]WFT81449.1 hypothetical protein QA634_06050 [Methylobacterium nodulans]
MNIVFMLAQITYDHDERGAWTVLKAQERSHVLWTPLGGCSGPHWEDADGTLHARVVRGCDLTGPNHRHAVQVVENEEQAFDFAETFGDEIPLADDDITLPLPEPAVPDHHIAVLLSEPFLTCDGLIQVAPEVIRA